jgi:hypothetical protein
VSGEYRAGRDNDSSKRREIEDLGTGSWLFIYYELILVKFRSIQEYISLDNTPIE